MREVSRAEVLAFRVRAHQLHRARGEVVDTAVLDLGVQDTGPDGARWALAVRGLAVPPDCPDLVTTWTLRGAPHVYRRSELPGVAAATAPFSEADAAKRVFDAARPLRAAGIPVLAALDRVAGEMRAVVTAPTVKGEMSRRLTERLDAPYLRFCRVCDATHPYEQPFRLAALRAGLELRPGTSPPVLQPVPGLVPSAAVPAHLDVVRCQLRLFGPVTPQQVAAYLDAPVAEVKRRWPEDAVEVSVEGTRRWVLADDVDRLPGDPARTVRLLGPFDPYLQARDRELLVPDPAQAKALWPVLGRPGAVLVDGEVAGTWRPRSSGRGLGLQVELWRPVDRSAVDEQAQRLAEHRGVRLTGLQTDR